MNPERSVTSDAQNAGSGPRASETMRTKAATKVARAKTVDRVEFWRELMLNCSSSSQRTGQPGPGITSIVWPAHRSTRRCIWPLRFVAPERISLLSHRASRPMAERAVTLTVKGRPESVVLEVVHDDGELTLTLDQEAALALADDLCLMTEGRL